MQAPEWHAWATGGVIVLATVAMAARRAPADAALLVALTALLALGVIEPASAAMGFADPAVLLIGALFVVAQGLRDAGALRGCVRWISNAGFGGAAQALVAGASALLNNTAVVALAIPVVRDAARRHGVSASRVLMPLSFAAMLGGACTLIGTSTNVVVNELWLEHLDARGVDRPGAVWQFWWMAPVAAPAALLGMGFMLLASRWLLPERRAPDEVEGERSYAVAIEVNTDADMVGRTIQDAGLRRIPGLFLSAIDREGDRAVAPGPDEVVHAGDALVFAGDVAAVAELLRRPGLRPLEDKPNATGRAAVVEVVVPEGSLLVGQTVRESRFRTRFDAAIVAIHRGGERVGGRLGDIRLRAGDTLLLWTHEGFHDAHRESRRLLIVSSEPVRNGRGAPGRAWIAGGVLLLLVALLGTPLGVPKLAAGFGCAALMVLLRCTSVASARAALPWDVLLAVAAAIGLGRAAESSGLADHLADGIMSFASHPHALLAVVALATVVVTQLVTNQAAAVLLFPIVVHAAEAAGARAEPFVVTLMVMASASFLTPTGYATNLMVYGPGGYRFGDFARLGAPLTLLVGVACVVLAPIVYPF
ncbi:MAG: SLC13 family permease [Planctomycetota bacterium]